MSTEMPNLSAVKKPESKPSSIDAIRSRLEDIKALAAARQLQWESEKASVAKEIVDMAEGNKALDERTQKSTKPYRGEGYQEMLGNVGNAIQKIQNRLVNIDQVHKEEKQGIGALREELAKQQVMATQEDQEQYTQLLAELDQQAQSLDDAHNKEVAEAHSTLEAQRSKYSELSERVNQSTEEMNQAAKDPYKFATETVLDAHKEFGGKDYSGQKQEIDGAVTNEAQVREYFKEANSELPKVEAYLALVEEKLTAFKKILDDSYAQAIKEYKAVEDDLNGPTQEIVAVQSQIIEKGRNAGFLARLAKAESKGTNAEIEMHSLKAQKFEKISDIYTSCVSPTVEIYYALAYSGKGKEGDFSAGTFADNFPGYKLERWEKFAEKNPAAFGAMAEKIKELLRRGEAIGTNRNELLATYQNNYNHMNNRSGELREKVQKMFTLV